MERWLPGRAIRAGTIKFAPERAYVHGEHFKGSVQLAGFTVRDRTGALRKLDSRLEIDARAVGDELGIKRFAIHLPPSARAANTATVMGRLNLTQPSAVTGKLLLNAEALDVTRLMDVLLAEGGKPPAAAAPITAPKVSAKSRFAGLTVGLDVKKLYWRDLNATAVRGEVVLNAGAVKLDPVEMNLLGAGTMAEGWIVPRGRDTAFSLTLNTLRLPLTPLMRHFHPNLKFELGEATLRTYAQADAITGPAFSRSLQIRGIDEEIASLTITGAKLGRKPADPEQPAPAKPAGILNIFGSLGTIGMPLETLDGMAGDVVGMLGNVFAVGELKDAFISDVDLKLQVKQGITNYDLTARGHLIGFDSTGAFRLAPNWRDSGLKQSIDIHLIGRLVKRLNLVGGFGVKDDLYYSVLKDSTVLGTLRDPKLDELGLGQKYKLGTLRVLSEPARMIDSLLHLQNPVPDAINPFNLLKHLFPREEDED